MQKIFLLMALTAIACGANALVPIQLVNNSQFADSSVYIGLIGRANDHYMYIDLASNSSTNAAFTQMNESANTLHKTAGDWGYANCFVRLSQLQSKTIYIDQCYGVRMFVSFGSPMYLHAFADGYAGADLGNASDPNADHRWELIEFSYDNNNVLFANTTRVDAFQYPMGIELYGDVSAGANNAYMKRGELQNYATIINDWNTQFSSTVYDNCKVSRITKDNLGPIILQPSKVSGVRETNVFDQYINDIWTTFTTKSLHADMGGRGQWSGRVSGDVFTMTNDADATQVAHISKPTTTDVIEGAGTFATGTETDKAIQAQFCGAMNRGVIDLTKGDNVLQQWGDRTLYFMSNTYNQYVAFFHDAQRSHDGYTYAFCYDDTFDQSSTCATSHPSKLVVTIGGFTDTPGGSVTPTPDPTPNPDPTPAPSVGDTTVTGTTTQNLQYTCAIVQLGMDVTYTFTCTNSSDFTGLVPVIWDNSNGFTEHLNTSTWTFQNCTAGQTLSAACKWMYAGGDTYTDYINYTVKEASATGLEEKVRVGNVRKVIVGGRLMIRREDRVYDVMGRKL